MFKIVTPIVLAVLAVTASKEGSNDITRRLLGEDFNNIDGVLEVKNDEKIDGPLMMKAQDVDDDNRDNGSMMMAQNGDDNNGLESRHGGYVRGNDYFKRDYYDKPYYPRYRATEGGESDGAAFSMMANEGGNPDDGAARFALMDEEAGDDNSIALGSRYGGYRRNNYGYNGYRRNYYKNNGYGPYWANEGGEMESFSSPVPKHDHGKIPYLANQGGNPEMDSSPFPDMLPARYGRYGRNDYYRNNRYDRYYKNERNDYYNGYDRQYRNGYNNDDRYRANEAGNNQEPDAFGIILANEGGNPGDDAAAPWAMMDGDAGDNNDRMALGSRYGGYRRNDYGYNGYNGYRRNYYKNNGFRPYWANEGGNAEMDSFSISKRDDLPVLDGEAGDDNRIALANQGGKPTDDGAAQGVFMANEGGNPEDGSRPWSFLAEEVGDGDDNNGLALASRYGRYGRNDYYRNNKYDGYYRNGHNDYYNGYDKQYRNRYNDGFRYRANEGGPNDGDQPQALCVGCWCC